MPNHNRIEQQILSRTSPPSWGPGSVLPDYAGYSIVALPSLVERLFGFDGSVTPWPEIASDLSGYDHVIMLLLDGLGYRKTESLFEHLPEATLLSLGRDGLFFPITSVFPSTTVAALVSISTGLTPLEHGLVGYRLYLRETSAITNMIRFAMVGNGRNDVAFSAGLDPTTIVPGATVHERLAGHGVDVHTLLPQSIAGSGLSRVLYKGSAKLHPVAGLSDMLVSTRELLAQATSRTFLSLYWPGLDTLAHVRGPESEAYVAEFRAIDDAIQRELLGQCGNTLLIVTADHGFVPMPAANYIQFGDAPEIDRALLLPPVGEPRATYLHVRDGAKQRVAEILRQWEDQGLVCVDSHVLIDDQVLGTGTPHPGIHDRIGDLAVVATGSAGIFHPYQDAVMLRGMHGGLTEDEMLVPFIASSL